MKLDSLYSGAAFTAISFNLFRISIERSESGGREVNVMWGILSFELWRHLIIKSTLWNRCGNQIAAWLKPTFKTQKKNLSMTSRPFFFWLWSADQWKSAGWFDDTQEWKRHCGHRLAMGTHSGRDHKLWVKQRNSKHHDLWPQHDIWMTSTPWTVTKLWESRDYSIKLLLSYFQCEFFSLKLVCYNRR